MPRLTQCYGIDTSVFVRLLTGHPEADFKRTTKALERLHDDNPATILVVSNQVVGEAYVTLQHFYGISKSASRKAILYLFNTGIISPLNGQPILDILSESGGAGLMDRLITQDYLRNEATVLTNDRRMAKLEGARLL